MSALGSIMAGWRLGGTRLLFRLPSAPLTGHFHSTPRSYEVCSSLAGRPPCNARIIQWEILPVLAPGERG